MSMTAKTESGNPVVLFCFSARLSKHSFPSQEEEDDALIYKYPAVYCDAQITHFEQCYFF